LADDHSSRVGVMNYYRLPSIVAMASAMLVFFLVAGCASRSAGAKTITHQQLVEMVEPTYRQSLIDTVTYHGSSEGYDYFSVSTPALSSVPAPAEYRVAEWDSPIRNRFPLNSRLVGYHPMSGLTDEEMRSDLERLLRRNERLFDQQPSLREPSQAK
jgi:hypothetical protein